jgi:outer membrane protein assembly factor BamB
LAYDALDRGDPEEALAWSRYLETASSVATAREVELSLLKAACWVMRGEMQRARRSLGKLKTIQPPRNFYLGRHEHTTADAIDQLLAHVGGVANKTLITRDTTNASDWLLFRGDAARNASGAWSGAFGEQLWKVGMLDVAELQQFRAWKRSAPDEIFFSCLHPLVIGNLILARSPQRLVAINAQSGRQIWAYPPEKPGTAKNKDAGQALRGAQSFWDNAPYGQLSSNGSEVYLLENVDAQQDDHAPPKKVVLGAGGQVLEPKTDCLSNRLTAIDLRENGKSAWSVGGVDGGAEPKLAGCFFLGPPLPHRRQLYVLAEKEGSVRLCVLEAASGHLQWSLALAQPEAAIHDDPLRRLAGATPSFADGILVCPTSAGAVAAVDPATHRLLWGFGYPVAEESVERGRQGLQRLNGRIVKINKPPLNLTARDETAVLAGGCALLLPVESDRLFCLDLTTGGLRWSCPRNAMLFIAGVVENNVILAGERGLFARNLQSGKAAWQKDCIELPGKAQIVGQGFLAGNFYFAPSSWDELVKFDLHKGQIAARFPAKGQLGNLTAAHDRIVSQTGDTIRAFTSTKEPIPQHKP